MVIILLTTQKILGVTSIQGKYNTNGLFLVEIAHLYLNI